MLPLFVATAPRTMRPELTAAMPGDAIACGSRASWRERVLALASPCGWRDALRGPGASLRRSARVKAPALVITGEPGLDRVLPVDVTRRYLDDFARREHVVMKHTGHLGFVTRPDDLPTCSEGL